MLLLFLLAQMQRLSISIFGHSDELAVLRLRVTRDGSVCCFRSAVDATRGEYEPYTRSARGGVRIKGRCVVARFVGDARRHEHCAVSRQPPKSVLKMLPPLAQN